MSGSVNTTLEFNHFFDNDRFGVDATGNSGEAVTAVNNWWGSPSGPYHPTGNPLGQGDNVSDYVEFIPWLLTGEGGDPGTLYWYVNASAPEGGNGSLEFPFNHIQEAVDSAGESDVILVSGGMYRENVFVDQSLELVGTGDGRTIVEGINGGGVMVIRADNVRISGFRLMNGSSGIRVQSSNVTLSWNDCSGNVRGILVEQERNVTITDNICSDSSFVGIMLSESFDSLIEGNICDGNENFGILVFNSDTITIRENQCSDNGLYGICLMGTMHNTLVDNRCDRNGNHGIHLEYSDWTLIQGSLVQENEVGIHLLHSHNNRIQENDGVGNNDMGIYVEESQDNEVVTNNCSENDYGIYLMSFSKRNTLESNLCLSNRYQAIYINEKSEFNEVVNNTCSGGSTIGYSSGILVSDSDHNLVTGNEVSMVVRGTGITCTDSDHVTLQRNTCSMNEDGITSFGCSSLQILENIVSANSRWGIFLQNSESAILVNNTCSRNGNVGIVLEASDLILIGNTIDFNEIGIRARETSGTTVQYNDIYGNRVYGIEVSSGAQFDLSAEYNWWGDPSGPYHPQRNPLGLGDRVSDKVIFSPWLGIGTEVDLQTTYYVSAEAIEDEGDGSQEHPYATIWKALDRVRRGDTIRVFAGVYSVRPIIDEKVSIIGNGSSNTIIDGGGNHYGVEIRADGVRFSGFTVRNTSGSWESSGIKIENSNGNSITDVSCQQNLHGIYVVGSSENVFEGVSCFGNSGHGMVLGEGSNGNIIRNSWFYNNGGSGVELSGSVYNNIYYCTILNNAESGVSVTNCVSITFANNSIDHNPYGIVLNNSNAVTIRWNYIFGNSVSGILMDTSVENAIWNNSISNNIEGIIVSGASKDNTITGNEIKGNEVYGLNATDCLYSVDARMNDWGNVSGPYHAKKNPRGTGNRVSENVVFRPWIGMIDSPGGDDDEEPGVVITGLLVAVLIFLVLLLALVGLAVFSEHVPDTVGRYLPLDQRFRK